MNKKMVNKKMTKSERIRRKKLNKIRNMVFDLIILLVFLVGGFIFVNGFFNAWDNEANAQAEYNSSYQQECEIQRMKNMR